MRYDFAVDSVKVDERRMCDKIRAAHSERWAEAVARKWKFLPGASFESTWFGYVLNDLECQYPSALPSRNPDQELNLPASGSGIGAEEVDWPAPLINAGRLSTT